MDPADPTPVSYGLNTKVVKEDGKVVEKPWKIDGIYDAAIRKIVGELELAREVAENDIQKEALGYLIDYYKTGDQTVTMSPITKLNSYLPWN